jgi:hypothetical protein
MVWMTLITLEIPHGLCTLVSENFSWSPKSIEYLIQCMWYHFTTTICNGTNSNHLKIHSITIKTYWLCQNVKLIHGRVCLQQHSAFINPTNTFLCKSWFAPQAWCSKCAQNYESKVENRAMGLANVLAKLIFNLEETKRWYKENVDEHWKEEPNFKVENQVWFWQDIKTTRASKKLDH